MSCTSKEQDEEESKEADDTFSTSEEFLIIDASCFGTHASTPNKPDLEFHSIFPCPVCGSFQSHFICEKCVNSGSFTSSRRPNATTYSEISTRLTLLSHEIKSFNETLTERGLPKTDSVKELELLIEILKSSIAYQREQNKQKQKRLDRVNQSISRCHVDSRQLSERNTALLRHVSSINKKRTIFVKNLAITNNKIEWWRVRYFKELLLSLFPVQLAANAQTPDEFVHAALWIDRVNAFIGPEPIRSSQVALTYCVPIINAATKLLDIWLPPAMTERLRLSGPLLATVPQRDTLGSVYSAVLHAVHLLCSYRAIDVRARLERLGYGLQPMHSEYNPLLGLYCLGRADPLKEYSGPYCLKLDGLFGTLTPPGCEEPRSLAALRHLRLEHEVEQGEEVKELDEEDEEPSIDVGDSLSVSTECSSAVHVQTSDGPMLSLARDAPTNGDSEPGDGNHWEFVVRPSAPK